MMLSSSIYRKHSTVQSALHKAAKQEYVPIRARQRKQVDRVGESREPACRRAVLQLAVFSKRTKKSKYVRPTKIYNHSQL